MTGFFAVSSPSPDRLNRLNIGKPVSEDWSTLVGAVLILSSTWVSELGS